MSPAGPINALDVIYGYQSDIQKGNIFMAHNTAFDINLLIEKIMLANFNYAFVARDKFYCLHGIAFKEDWTENQIKKILGFLLPSEKFIIENKWVMK